MEPVPNHNQDAKLGIPARATIAICLIVAAIGTLAIASAIQDRMQATADARMLRRAPEMTWSATGYADADPFDFLEVDWGPLRRRR
jgi:hypothetical protein